MTPLLAGPALALCLAVAPAEATTVLGAADELYARRAEGSAGPVCATAPIDAALDAYRKALALDPGSAAARRGLLRALFFRGGFCATPREPRIRLFAEAKELAEETVKRMEGGLPGSRRERRAAVLRRDPAAAETYLWAAVAWAQWTVDHKLAAAWQGAGSRIRDLAEAVIAIAPETLDGGAQLILGRLHTEAPKLPLLTGWVSKERGLGFMREGLTLAPRSKQHLYFLGAALLQRSPAERAEARGLLQRCASEPERADSLVEDRHYADKAHRLLATLAAATAAP